MSDETRERQYKQPDRGQRRQLVGIVISAKMAKTISVSVGRTERHVKYLKLIKRHSKVYAHDEQGLAKAGDLVRVIEGRPRSKLKRFYLAEVLKSHGS